MTSGCHCIPNSRRPGCSNAAISAPAVDAGDPEPGRCDDDRVAVRHPHRLLGGLAGEEHGVGFDGRGGAPELGDLRALHRAAERLGHRLEAVADAERGHAGVEQRGVDARCTLGVDAGGATREDHRRRALRQHVGHRHLVGHDLAVDVRLADAAGDQLRVLRPEVDHQDGAGLRRFADRLTHPPRLHGLLRDCCDAGTTRRNPNSSVNSTCGSSTLERPVIWTGLQSHDPEGTRWRIRR